MIKHSVEVELCSESHHLVGLERIALLQEAYTSVFYCPVVLAISGRTLVYAKRNTEPHALGFIGGLHIARQNAGEQVPSSGIRPLAASYGS